MKTLTRIAYESLTDGAESLSHDVIDGKVSHKVLRLNDHSILKLFRVKRLISSAHVYPYAKRFRNNAISLASFHIPTVQVSAIYRIPFLKRTAVLYTPLKGITLRDHGIQNAINTDLAGRLGVFFSNLHQHGIYFRSIHFGNIILTPENRFGLIDIADMRIYRHSLNTNRRIRNLRHFFRYRCDADMLAPVSHHFLDVYYRKARLKEQCRTRFGKHFNNYLKF